MKRLQGYEWVKMRPYLTLISWSISNNGHYRADLKHKISGAKYFHWLSESEARRFEKVKDQYPQTQLVKRSSDENPKKDLD